MSKAIIDNGGLCVFTNWRNFVIFPIVAIIGLIVVIFVFSLIYWCIIPKVRKPKINLDKPKWKTNYTNVFVHGVAGWGSYDERYRKIPYWGMLGGDMLTFLNQEGFNCYAASVSPFGSAWDRACELYAQLTGTRVDYGKAHSEKMNHPRFGEDFTGKALIGNWNSEHKINLIAHSFGGTTIRVLCQLLAEGCIEEQKVTDSSELSELFKGNKSDWIYSMTCLATPHNGTTAYMVAERTNEMEGSTSIKSDKNASKLSSSFSYVKDGRMENDYAEYDMEIDHARKMNEFLPIISSIYYFSYPYSITKKSPTGIQIPMKHKVEKMFKLKSQKMGAYIGETENGFQVTDQWQENDGLVNTFSALAPFGQKIRVYNSSESYTTQLSRLQLENRNSVNIIKPGVWNVMPVTQGDHMSVIGGILKVKDVRKQYAEILEMINKL